MKRRIATDDIASKRWRACVDFFQTHRKLNEDVRNDFGGHFGERAARAVIQELPNDPTPNVAELEFNLDETKHGLHLRYAEEIAAIAMHHRGARTHAEWRDRLFSISKQAFIHAGQAVHVIVFFYVLDRFRSRHLHPPS